MRKLLLAVAVPCLLAGLASADGITSSTFCSVSVPSTGIAQTMMGPSNCHTSMAGNTATADVSYSLNLPFAAASNGYIGARITASTNPSPSNGPSSPTVATDMTADASITLQYTLTTPGPVRMGYVQVDRLLSAAGYDYRNAGGIQDDFADVHASIGTATSVVCPENGECSGPSGATLFAITLGQPFVFSEDITLDTSDSIGGMGLGFDYGDFVESGSAGIDFNFRLLESDASTPVSVELVPEPNMFWLFTAAAYLTLMARQRLRPGRRNG